MREQKSDQSPSGYFVCIGCQLIIFSGNGTGMGWEFVSTLLLSLLAKIKVWGVLPAHLPLVLDAGILVSVLPLSWAGFVCFHCTGRWAELDNKHDKDSGAYQNQN